MTVEPALLEREHDLEALESMLADARGARGALAVVEAPAGQGKTALLRAVRARAQETGMRVIAATGAELERDFAFGVVRQLFAPVLNGDNPSREQLLSGAAALASPIFDVAEIPSELADASHARLHGLFWLCSNLAEVQPLLLVVDDAHWADAPSLRFLDVIARRVEDMPVLAAVATRPDEPEAEKELIDGLVAASASRMFHPGPLSAAAIGRLAEQLLGAEPDPAFAAAAADSTGGNALFVRELLRAARDAGLSGAARDLDALRRTPDTVTRMVVARFRRLPEGPRQVGRAVAVLGERSTSGRVAKLAGLSREDAFAGIETLVQAGLLDAGRLAFVHPIVRDAVLAGTAGAEVRNWHRKAARLLSEGGARDDEIATHLSASEPEGDAWAARLLAAAGRRALADGAPDVAGRLLARAMEEPPAEEDRAGILLDLGLAGARTGSVDAITHLEAAAESGGDPVVVGKSARVIAYVMTGREPAPKVLHVLRDALEVPGLPDALREDLENHYLQALWYSEGLIDEYMERMRAGAAQGHALALGHLAAACAFGGAHRDEVVERVLVALADGRVLRSLGEEHYDAYHAIEALHAVEAVAEADAVLRDAEAVIRRTGSPFALATLAYMRPTWERLFGDLRRAECDLRDALDLFRANAATTGIYVSSVNLALTLLDRGAVDEAAALLAQLPEREHGVGMVGLHGARARLHAERGEWDRALAEAELHYEAERPRNIVIWPRGFLRVLHVRSLQGLGRMDEACAFAEAEITLHQGRGAAGHEAMARLSRAGVVGGGEGIDELRRAAECAARSPMRLVEAQVLAELGAALRRAGHRVDSREPLRRARDLARRVGATGLEERVHQELVVAGARPQRVALAGVDSLTPSERRVVDLAAQGMTNRQIAETLFVTLKTVEVHLGRAYGKLGIKSRTQLAGALAAE